MPARISDRKGISPRKPASNPVDLSASDTLPAERLVGMKIRGLRNQRGFSLRTLAERSGLNINTLCLIENGKSSPTVGTLHQLAGALEVPMTAFFESQRLSKRVVFTDHNHRPEATFNNAHVQNLGQDLAGSTVQPFVVTLERGAGSGEHRISHTGHEMVYCLSGKVVYTIDELKYSLDPGDSVVFEAHLPHQWKNVDEGQSQILLIFTPADQREDAGERHFTYAAHSQGAENENSRDHR